MKVCTSTAALFRTAKRGGKQPNCPTADELTLFGEQGEGQLWREPGPCAC